MGCLTPRGSIVHVRWVMPVIIVWFIWCVRNKANFEGEVQRLESIIFRVTEFMHLLEMVGSIVLDDCKGDRSVYLVQNFAKQKLKNVSVAIVHWNTAPSRLFKLNTDALVR